MFIMDNMDNSVD